MSSALLRGAYNLALLTGMAVGSPFLAVHALRGRSRSIAKARLGLGRDWLPPADRSGAIWVHALSVGEALSALPLVEGLAQRLGPDRVVMSLATAQGLAVARERLGQGSEVPLFVRTLDLPWLVRRTLDRLAPSLFILVEGDLWPNLQWALARQGVPAMLVNGRVSPRAARRYGLARPLARALYEGFAVISLQSSLDRDRLAGIGIDPGRLRVGGNLKFDSAPAPLAEAERTELLERWGLAGRTVLVAGSTHGGEETICLEAYARLQAERPGLSLIIAPRRTDRGAEVADLATGRGLSAARTSQGPVLPGTQVVVLDEMGLLARAYGLARAALVGGSLVSQGGHNPLEPAAQGVPVVFGQHMEDFSQVADQLKEAGAGLRLAGAEELVGVWGRLLADDSATRTMGQAGQRAADEHKGSVKRTLDWAMELMEQGRRG